MTEFEMKTEVETGGFTDELSDESLDRAEELAFCTGRICLAHRWLTADSGAASCRDGRA